jgi:hypothetical protein
MEVVTTSSFLLKGLETNKKINVHRAKTAQNSFWSFGIFFLWGRLEMKFDFISNSLPV